MGTSSETPPELGVPAKEADCPTGEDDVVRVVHGSNFDEGEVPIGLKKNAESIELPRGAVSFTLTNGTETTFMMNPYRWSVWKHIDGDWLHVLPQFWNQPLMELGSGDEHTWTVTIANEDEDGLRPAQGTDGDTVAGIGGGEYAFVTNGWFEGDGHEEKTGFCAGFTVEGGAVEVTPTESAVAERDDDTVVVTDDRDPTEHTRLAAFVLTRTEETEDAERMIPEQAVRWDYHAKSFSYRNTLPFFEEGVNEVRYETYNGTHPAFGVQEPHAIEYEGEFYRVSAEELG